MDFEPSERRREFAQKLHAFLDDRVYAAEPVYRDQMLASGQAHFHPRSWRS